MGTLEDKLRKAPDKSISLHRSPFTPEGNLESEGGVRIPGTSNGE
jgi:hypothetical protein